MQSAQFPVRTDSELKEKAQKKAERMGLSLNQVVNNYLKQFVSSPSETFIDPDLKPEVVEELKQAQQDRLSGIGSPMFTDNEELIKKDPKKYRPMSEMEKYFDEQGI